MTFPVFGATKWTRENKGEGLFTKASVAKIKENGELHVLRLEEYGFI